MCSGSLIGRPVRRLDAVELDLPAVRCGRQTALPDRPDQPLAEAGDRREGGELAQLRVLRRELPHHLLDEEVAEGDAGEPSLAVADRIEDGGVRRDVRFHRPEEQVRDRAGQPVAQRDLDEDERLVGQRRVKESEAAPIRLEATAQIVPVEDLVHCFVLGDFFEHEGRCSPVDAVQLEEPAVEPGTEHANEIIVHHLELRAPGQCVEQGRAHREDVARSVRSGIHQVQELMTPRLGRRPEGRCRFRTR